MEICRNNNPGKALPYLEKAAVALDVYYTDENLYCTKSECNNRLGNYEEAEKDAQTALNVNPYSVKGLVGKAEALYNLGSFEHSLKFWWR